MTVKLITILMNVILNRRAGMNCTFGLIDCAAARTSK